MKVGAWVLLAALVLGFLPGSPTDAAWQGDSPPSGERAVVLGGGGPTGQAWEMGVLKGLRDAGVDLAEADVVIGTSAGSVAAAQLLSGLLDDFYDALLAPPTIGHAYEGIDLDYFTETSRMWQGVDATPETLVEVGTRALTAPQVIAEDAFVGRTAVRLGVAEWPSEGLQIAATDVYDGTLHMFDRTQGVSIGEAVAASTALPGLSEPISLGRSRYMDGGVAGSSFYAAQGYRRVVALIPGGGASARVAAEALRANGSNVLIIMPDAESTGARGPDNQDPTRMRASAEAGRRQGALIAEDIASIWNGNQTGR